MAAAPLTGDFSAAQIEFLQTPGDGIQFIGDGLQCFIARSRPGKVDGIDADGQSRHVLNEKIDRRAALHRKNVVGENVRCRC